MEIKKQRRLRNYSNFLKLCNVVVIAFLVIFQKRVRVFHRGFKHEKTENRFLVFETPMKHEARVFEITSPTKEN